MKQLKITYRMILLRLLQNRLAASDGAPDAVSLFLSRRIDRIDAAFLARRRVVEFESGV